MGKKSFSGKTRRILGTDLLVRWKHDTDSSYNIRQRIGKKTSGYLAAFASSSVQIPGRSVPQSLQAYQLYSSAPNLQHISHLRNLVQQKI